MREEAPKPSFVAFAFDYSASSDWADLPLLREGISRLTTALSGSMQQQLSELRGTSAPTIVMEALEHLLLNQLSPDDSILIYLGGHGIRLGNDHFIVGPTARRGSLTARSGISAADLAQVLVQGRPRQVCLILDACYSAAAAVRLAADVDAVISRERRTGIALSLISSARSLDESLDGTFVETLLEILADPNPVLWSRKHRRISPHFVARALSARLDRFVEFREHGYVGPLFPNLAYRILDVVESARRTREHFLVATSGLEPGTRGWHFVGRTAALSAIATWLKTENSGIFVITGPPGSGKSAILGRVALLADPAGREEVIRRDPTFEPSAPTTPALGSVAVAIYAREKTLEIVVSEIASGLRIEPSVNSRDELLALLSEKSLRACILIDALDEAAADDVLPITEFLRDMAGFPGMKVLVGTRPDRARTPTGSSRLRFGPILNVLEPERIWDLQEDLDSGGTDITIYVRARLSDSRNGSPYLDRKETVLAIAEEIARRVNGVFLYARLMVEALIRQPPLNLKPGWEVYLPGGTGGDLLASVVADDLHRIPPTVRDRVRLMLMALAWTQGEGLPRYRVWPAIATAIAGSKYSDIDATSTIHYAAWYLVESTESEQIVYRLHHEELVRYFKQLSKSESELEVQKRITRELRKFGGNGGMGWLNTNPYLRRHLGAHAVAAEMLGELVLDVGFLGSADPSRLIPALTHIETRASTPALSNAHAYLRLSADRVGATIGCRVANLELACATEEPEAKMRFDEVRNLTPWLVQFAQGRRVPFQGSPRLDTSEILGLACSTRAGRPFIATASLDNRLRLWDGHTGELIAELKGHRDIVRSVAIGIVGDVERVVSGSADGDVRVWDPRSKLCILTIRAHMVVNCVAIGRIDHRPLIAAGFGDGSIRVWDANGEDVIAAFRAHSDGVTSLVYGVINGSSRFVSGSLDRSVSIWDPETGERILSVRGPAGSTLGVTVGAIDDRPVIAAANSDESVWIWDANSGEVLHRLEGHTGAATCVCFGTLGDQPVVASGSADVSIRIWDCRTGKCLHTLDGHRGGIRTVQFAQFADETFLISGSADRTIRVWEIQSGQSIAPTNSTRDFSDTIWAWTSPPQEAEAANLEAHRDAVRSVAFGAIENTRLVISGSLDQHIHIRNAETGELLNDWQAHLGGVLAVSFMVVGNTPVVVSGGADAAVRVWNALNGSLLHEFLGHERAVWGVCCGAVDGKPVVVSGSRDRTVRVWDTLKQESIFCLTGTPERVWGVALGKVGDRPTIAAASTDRLIWLWDAHSGECVRRLQGHARGTRFVTFGELDGKTVVIASSADQAIRVWDAATGDEVAKLLGHTDGIWGVTYAAYHGRHLAMSASDDLTVRIWDLKRKQSLTIPQTSPAYSVAFTDGWLAVGTHRHVYSLKLQDAILGQMDE